LNDGRKKEIYQYIFGSFTEPFNLNFRHWFVAGRIRNTVDVMVNNRSRMVKVGYEALLFKLAVLQVLVSMQCMRSAILFY